MTRQEKSLRKINSICKRRGLSLGQLMILTEVCEDVLVHGQIESMTFSQFDGECRVGFLSPNAGYAIHIRSNDTRKAGKTPESSARGLRLVIEPFGGGAKTLFEGNPDAVSDWTEVRNRMLRAEGVEFEPLGTGVEPEEKLERTAA